MGADQILIPRYSRSFVGKQFYFGQQLEASPLNGSGLPLYENEARPTTEDFAHRSPLSGFEWLHYTERPTTYFLVASDGGLSQKYGRDGSGVCLGNGQTGEERVPSQGDALLRRMPQILDLT